MGSVPTRPRGRPRDPAINDAITTATRELLLEIGYAGLSMEAVAARAGIGKPTLYRRYPSKAALVFDAVLGKTKSRATPDSGDIVVDLREAYSWVVDEFAAPEVRAALPGILGELSANPALAQHVRSLVIDPESTRVQAALRQAQDRGQIRTDVDLQVTVDAFIGTALARATLLDHPVDHAFGDELVDLLTKGLSPQ